MLLLVTVEHNAPCHHLAEDVSPHPGLGVVVPLHSHLTGLEALFEGIGIGTVINDCLR